MEDSIGCFNESADLIERKNETWSDTNLEQQFTEKDIFIRLQCRNCGGISFEVIQTDSYGTSAQCKNCSMYYIVYCG